MDRCFGKMTLKQPIQTSCLELKFKFFQLPAILLKHAALIFEEDDLGTVCIAQDVFWWEDGKQDTSSLEVLMNLHDPFASDVAALKESRGKVLEIADWIVPGHGKMFKPPEK